ncbi:outer membrane protein assembly factor BamB [Saccharospirillum sp. MSK14-1]|uniref:outer membrane protein assembly factor BamB n=1 Tax=Saccharospirillum sp. MSK14-1 TaxID=1897632 RepID=UPI000D3B5080|nr:outer membrane protein assembly factor BamB [Saccharospirillum sp. MSK14-1]PTY36094.1 outer membrane protein assembly factor BamB [Saccharospirillum sp. MSK14-1]
MRNALILAALVSVLTACAGGSLREAPAPLPEERPQLADLRIDWWQMLEERYTEMPFSRIAPLVTERGILTASPLGEVALLSESGRFIWRRQLAEQITAPLAADERQMVIMTGNGDVKLFDWNGRELWSSAISALATEAPLLLEDRLIVQTMDGRVMALERNTGRPLWVYQDAEPELTITGTARPLVVDDLVVTGLANGKLVGLSLADGSPAWEYRIARAQGKTDVSRLVDVDASVTRVGDYLLAAGYQGDMLVLDAASGQVLASQPLSTYRAVVPGQDYWYAVNDQSHVVALDPRSLAVVWTQDQFTYRRLSQVLPWKDALAVSDADGYVHLLDAQTGEWLATRQVDWTGAHTAPVALGDDYILQQGNSSRIKRLSFRRPNEAR